MGASDGWGMKGRDRRYDHVTRAGFVGSDASLTSWRVTTGRHRCGAVRCPDEDPVKLNAPAFNTGSVSGPAGAPSITTGVVASPIRFRIAMLRSLTRSGLAADPRVTLATVDAFHQASPEMFGKWKPRGPESSHSSSSRHRGEIVRKVGHSNERSTPPVTHPPRASHRQRRRRRHSFTPGPRTHDRAHGRLHTRA